MSKRGWQPINRWKKVSPKYNEHESTECDANGSSEHTVHGQAKTGQGAITPCDKCPEARGRRSAEQAFGQSTTEQGARKEVATKPVGVGTNTVNQSSQRSVVHQDAMGQPIGQGIMDDDATSRSAVEFACRQVPLAMVRDLRAADKCARELGTFDKSAIKDAILEMGALERFAVRQDVILGVMGREAVKQCDKILSSKDDSIGHTFSQPAPLDRKRQVAKNLSTTTQITSQLGAAAQVATGQGAMEPNSQKLSTIGSVATKGDDMRQSEPCAMGQAATGQGPMRQPVMEPATIPLNQFNTELVAVEQVTTEQDSQRQSTTKPRAMGQVATENDAMLPLRVEPATARVPLGQDAVNRFSTEPVSMEPVTVDDIGHAAVFPKSRPPGEVGTLSLPTGPIDIGRGPMRQSRTEAGTMGHVARGSDSITPFRTELVAIGPVAAEDDETRPYNTESNTICIEPGSVEQSSSTTLDSKKQYGPEQYSVNYKGRNAVLKSRRSEVVSTLGQPAINISTTEPGSMGQIAAEQGHLRQSAPIPGSSWTQTDLYSESTQCKEEHYPTNRVFGKKTYLPDWLDLDRRPLPRWYDEAKIGIIIHWGLYSVPSYKSEWFWYLWKKGNREIVDFMSKMYRGDFTYQEFGTLFKAQYFDPVEWATLFAKAGAKYVILTAKHHDGFKLFPSKNSFNWNSYDIGPKRDIVKELSKAVVDKGLKFGIYYSLYEWFNPIYEEDKKAFFKTRDYVNQMVWPDLMQLVNSYKPSILWTDGDWEANQHYWKSQEFISWVYNDSPVRDYVVVNNRWGCKQSIHGDFYNRDDRHNQPTHESNFTKFHKWEASITMDKQQCWCYRREARFDEIMTIEELLLEVVTAVSCGGLYIMTAAMPHPMGPTAWYRHPSSSE